MNHESTNSLRVESSIESWGSEIPLEDHLYVKGRIGWRGLKRSEYTKDGPILISGFNIVNDKTDWNECFHISDFRYKESPEIALRPKDIIMTKDGTIGRMSFLDQLPGPATINATMMLIRVVSDDFDPHFVYYYFQSNRFQDIIKAKTSGSSVPHIFQRDITGFRVPLVPIGEQQRIAVILDTVDRTIAQTERIIEKLKAIKSGLLHDLLTRGIGEDGSVRDPEKHPEVFKNSDVGLIPEKWNVESLGNLGDVVGGTTPSTSVPEYWNGTIPFVIPTDITNHEDSDYLTTTDRYITKRGLDSISSNLLPAGSVLITSRATIGYATISQVPLVTNQGILSVVCGNNLHNEYLIYLIRFYKRQLERLGSGTTFLEVGRNAMRNLQIPAPQIAEQMEIARILTSSQASIDTEKEMHDKLKMIKKGLMHDLLTGRVRVKVPEEKSGES